MPKTRTIVATTNPQTGEPLAAGAEVELDEEAYQSLRAQGAVEASEEEQQEHATPEAQGNYSARAGRGDVGDPAQPKAETAPHEDDDKPKAKK